MVPVKWHSMKVSYEIVINHKNVPKKDFLEVSHDDKTGLYSIATGRTNDNIVCILWELHKFVHVKWHSMKVSNKIVINHKHVPKKNYSEVSLDDKTGLSIQLPQVEQMIISFVFCGNYTN